MISLDSPILINVLIYGIYVLLLAAIGLTVWSMVHSVCVQGKTNAVTNRIPQRRIIVLTVAVVALTLVLTWVLASTKPLIINGKPFTDSFWLRTSDMLINTSIVLIIVCIVGVVLSRVKGLRSKVKG